jgi:superfamily II DNA or RNA helicase
MSGLEFLGAFASAIQLAEFGIKITTVLLETLERLQSYPAQLECHICQVKQLLETTRLIERNRGLQTDIVHSHLNSTLVVAADLQTALEQFAIDYLHKSVRRRFWKIALKGALQEKQIALRFERLEREKSALIFCVTVVHADALANIQGGVELLVDVIAQGMGCEVSIAV